MGFEPELRDILIELEKIDKDIPVVALLAEADKIKGWFVSEDLSAASHVLQVVRDFLEGTGGASSCGKEGADLASYIICQAALDPAHPQSLHLYQRACANLALAVSGEKFKYKYLVATCNALAECDIIQRRSSSLSPQRRLLTNLRGTLQMLQVSSDPQCPIVPRSRNSLLAS